MEAIKSIDDLKPYRVDDFNYDIRLDANESPFNLFGKFKDKIFERLNAIDLNRYPDTDSNELRERYAEYVDLQKENIICGNGSDEIIRLIISAFVDCGKCVLMHTPTFSMYRITTEILKGKAVEVKGDGLFNVSGEKVMEYASKYNPQVIFLCNPNNPTGNCFSREDIVKIIEGTNAVVVVDEAYFEFFGETVVDLVEACDRLIVLRTLSKAFSLAGARVGFGISSKRIIDVLNKVKPPYNLNSVSQMIACVYLENTDVVENCVKIIKEQTVWLFEELLNIEGLKVFNTHSNFIYIESSKKDKICAALKGNGIAVREFTGDPVLKDGFRISSGSEQENKLAVELIRKAVN